MNEQTATVPTIICGRFHLGRRLGQGTVGTVHRARDRQTGEDVAVKLFAADESARTPEALAALDRRATVRHPHVALCLAAGIEGECAYLVTELGSDERGEPLTLRRHLAFQPGHRLEGGEVVELGCQILSGLAALHASGFVHRNLKPENVLLRMAPDGTPQARLADYALPPAACDPDWAADYDLALVRSLPGQDGGRPAAHRVAHFCPEQRRGLPVGPAGDIYAAGVLLHEMATGRPELDVLLPSEKNPGLPPEFDEILARAVARDPGRRWASCQDMLAALEQIRTAGERWQGEALAVLSSPLPIADDTAETTPQERPSLLPVAAPVAAAVRPDRPLRVATPVPSAPTSPPAAPAAADREPLPLRRPRRNAVLVLGLLVLLGFAFVGGRWLWRRPDHPHAAGPEPTREREVAPSPDRAEPAEDAPVPAPPPPEEVAVAQRVSRPPAPVAADSPAPPPSLPVPEPAAEVPAPVEMPRDPAALAALLAAADPGRREQSALALLRLGPAGAMAAGVHLCSSDTGAAELALDLLAEHGRRLPQAPDLLSDAVRRSPSSAVRARALRLLADLAPESACRRALERLGDKDMGQEVADVLAAHGRLVAKEVVRQALLGKEAEREQAARAALAIGQPATAELAPHLEQARTEAQCLAALRLLAAFDAWAPQAQVAVARMAVEGEFERARGQAANLVHAVGEEGLRFLVREGLDASASRKRDQAAALVARLGEDALPLLLDTYRDAPSIRLRRAVRDTLMQMGDQGVQGLLQLLQGSARKRHQSELTQALADMGERAVPELVRALAQPQYRDEAEAALVRAGRVARPALHDLLDQPEPKRPARREGDIRRAEYEDIMDTRRRAERILGQIR